MHNEDKIYGDVCVHNPGMISFSVKEDMSAIGDMNDTAVIDCYHIDKNGDTWTMAELVKRNQELEWEIEDLEDAVADAQECCAAEWEKDCAMALRRICDYLKFERNPGGDTADNMAEWIMLEIEDLRRKANVSV